jgi:hypothetical protein
LIQSILTNFPVITTGFEVSYSAANEWCAKTGNDPTRKPIPAAKTISLLFIGKTLQLQY